MAQILRRELGQVNQRALLDGSQHEFLVIQRFISIAIINSAFHRKADVRSDSGPLFP